MLEVNNLKYSYKNSEILKGVTFDVRLNQIIGISGATSSGKSAIFETILNFREFSNGTIIFENKKVVYNIKKQINSLKKNIGYLPQNDYFLNCGTVLENFQWICKVSKDKVIEVATLTRITDILYSKIKEISKAEQIRFKLAIALIRFPSILFIDEPLQSLHKDEVEEFLDLVDEISKAQKVGVVISSQDLENFKRDRFDKIFRLKNGVLNEI